MKYTRYDAIRDFRIKNTQLMENLEKMNVSMVSYWWYILTDIVNYEIQNIFEMQVITQTRNENLNEDTTTEQQSEISDDNDSSSESEETPAKKQKRGWCPNF